MKRYVILVLVAFSAIFAGAKNIYWLKFVDTDDRHIGKMDQSSLHAFNTHVMNVVNASLASDGYTAVNKEYTGSDTSPENCTRTVSDLTCSSDDIIVFLYMGHGGRSTRESGEEHPWSQMWLAQNNPEKMVPVEWVHKQLKAKGARLCLVVTMCCNSEDPGISPKASPKFLTNFGATKLASEEMNAIRKLFLGYKGDVIITSSKAKESSWGPTSDNLDFFSDAFIRSFESLGNNSSWNSFFSDVCAKTTATIENGVWEDENGRIIKVTQHPFFKTNVVPTDMPNDKVNPEVPDKPDVVEDRDDKTNLDDVFGELFSYLNNKSLDLNTRRELWDMIKSECSSNAIVKFISQDGEMIIDRKPIDKYARRLMTSNIILLAVVPKGGVKLNSEGAVQEVYVYEVIKSDK